MSSDVNTSSLTCSFVPLSLAEPQSSNKSIMETLITCSPEITSSPCDNCIPHKNEDTFPHGETVLSPRTVSLCENPRPQQSDELFAHSDTVVSTISTNHTEFTNVCISEDPVSLCQNDPPHKNGVIFSHSDTALPLINSESFWQNYEIVKSRGDGHCFIYCAVSSLRCQHNMLHDAEAVLRYITHESLDNIHRYMYLFESVQMFELEMFNYINEKTYDSSYVDLLPHFLANALRLPIIVICQKDDAYDYTAIPGFLHFSTPSCRPAPGLSPCQRLTLDGREPGRNLSRPTTNPIVIFDSAHYALSHRGGYNNMTLKLNIIHQKILLSSERKNCQ